MRTRLFAAACFLAGTTTAVHAQTFFTPSAQYIEPASRGNPNAEFSWWDVLYSPAEHGNYPDMDAPNGTGGYASESGFMPPDNANPGDPYAFWHVANPTLTQVGTDTAFIIGAGTAGNIYSPFGETAFEIADTTPYIAGSVNLQWQTQGNLMDFNSLVLVYFDGFSYQELAPTNLISEYKSSIYHGGAFAPFNRMSAQWDLTGLGITNYTIKFRPAGTSCSLQEVLLDTAQTYTEVTPSTRVWAAAGPGENWSTAGNWQGGVVPVHAGNVVFESGTGAVVDGGQRMVSELTLKAGGTFTVSATGGSSLQINSGITATPDVPSSYTISAPLRIDSFNLIALNENADLTVSGMISGASGFYRYGGGVLRLTANNTFADGIVISGGTTIVSGASSYAGGTSVLSGRLWLQGNAPFSGSGTLGTNTGAVTLGADETLYAPQEEAAILIDGNYTVGKPFYVNFGSSPKRLGAQNASGSGAVFSGAITLSSGAGNLWLHAENAGDRVSFSGNISGGEANNLSIFKTGLGRVVLSGSNKSYRNNTYVDVGTLEIAAGTAVTGNGTMTMAPTGTLLVNGTLSGTGAININGGTVGGRGTIGRSLLLNNGDRLAPGDGIGTLTTGPQTWADLGRLVLELSDADGVAGLGWDLVTINGALDLAASNSGFTLELHTLTAGGVAGLLQDFNPGQDYAWKFAGTTGGIANFAASDFTIDISGFQNALNGGRFYVANSGNDLVLHFQVPEPSSALLLFAAGLPLLLRRRRPSRTRFPL